MAPNFSDVFNNKKKSHTISVRLAIVWTPVVYDQSCFTEQTRTTANRGQFSTTGGQHRSEVVGLLSIGIRIEPSVDDWVYWSWLVNAFDWMGGCRPMIEEGGYWEVRVSNMKCMHACMYNTMQYNTILHLHIYTPTHTHLHIYTHLHTHTPTYIHYNTTHTHTGHHFIQTDRQTHTHTHTEDTILSGQTDTHTHIHYNKDTQTERQTHTHTHTHTQDTILFGQRDRQTDTHTHTHTHTHRRRTPF